jgi:glycosyltransferase involved in cell wall biosynthesis
MLRGDVPPGLRLDRREQIAYRLYLSTARLDGIMTWYEDLREALAGLGHRAVLRSARYCFVDTNVFAPAPVKKQWIVHAGRLVDYKRPMLFIEALARARALSPRSLSDWHCFVFGAGPLDKALYQAINRANLENLVTWGDPRALRATLAQTSLFVSTQDGDNFTSLAMLEAMASGAAILARDVGQTRAFVRPADNGLLVSGDDPDSIAAGLLDFLHARERHAKWQAESRRITLEEHCSDNVIAEFDAFWQSVLRAAEGI